MSEPTIDRLPAPWGEHALEPDETLRLQVGPLVLWARAREDEVWLAHAPGDGTRSGRSTEPPAEPGDSDWIRWPVAEDPGRIVLSPVFSARPVVAEPDRSFRLLPRSRARIFVGVPLWVRVTVPGDPGRTLTDVPSLVLSDTWWGDVTEGELCYWLRTTARRRVSPETRRPHMAVCPLELANRSGEELPVEKIVLRVAHLSLFAGDGRFWADETRVQYRGADEASEIRVTGQRPGEAGDAEQVAAPREKAPARGFRALTVARLRSLPGLGGI